MGIRQRVMDGDWGQGVPTSKDAAIRRAKQLGFLRDKVFTPRQHRGIMHTSDVTSPLVMRTRSKP